MIKFSFAILLCCLLSSCATMLNNSYKNIAVHAEEPVTVKYKSGVYYANDSNTVLLTVDRARKPLELTVNSDSVERQINVKHKIDPVFYLNLTMPFFIYGIADLFSNKMYTYPSNIILNKDLTVNTHPTSQLKQKIQRRRETGRKRAIRARYNEQLPQKGDFYFDLSLPFIYITHSTTTPETMPRKSGMSVFGLSAGLDYYYKDNRFINLSGNVYSGGDIVIGCGGSLDDDVERLVSYSIMLSHNHKYRRFSFGYGLSYTYNDRWEERYLMPENAEGEKYDFHFHGYSFKDWRYSTLGLVFNGYTYFSPNFSVGLIYKPNFVRLKTNSGKVFNYEHQITLDFLFRIKLFGAKKKNK